MFNNKHREEIIEMMWDKDKCRYGNFFSHNELQTHTHTHARTHTCTHTHTHTHTHRKKHVSRGFQYPLWNFPLWTIQLIVKDKRTEIFSGCYFFKNKTETGVPLVAQWLTNPTRNHEVVGSTPGLTKWVKDLALLWAVV